MNESNRMQLKVLASTYIHVQFMNNMLNIEVILSIAYKYYCIEKIMNILLWVLNVTFQMSCYIITHMSTRS